MGVDQYPKDIEEAYDMMLGYSTIVGMYDTNNKATRDLYTTGISFYQKDASKRDTQEDQNNKTQKSTKFMPGKSGKLFKDILCYGCKMMGHYTNDCPNLVQTQKNNDKKEQQNKDTGFSFTQFDVGLAQAKGLLKPT